MRSVSREPIQPTLFGPEIGTDAPPAAADAAVNGRDPAPVAPASGEAAYRSRQLITCIGNKRALAPRIEEAVHRVRRRLGGRRLRAADLFAGSGVVSRHLKAHASYLAANDLEEYSAAISRCFLRNRSEVDLDALREAADALNALVDTAPLPPGFIAELYAPRDESRIAPGERVFYTRENARRLDDYRRRLGELGPETREMLLGPLLSEASVHANTAGVFKGFYKDRTTGIGRFGGSGADALSRILGRIELDVPVLSEHECDVEVFRQDANAVAGSLADLDLAYLDPPYNQHPYGSNYFMLNLLVRYERPREISRVSGIPVDWNRSGYNVRGRSLGLLRDLFERTDSRFLLVSYSNEAFVSHTEMVAALESVGRVQAIDIPYTVFRGSRNIAGRSARVTEHLFLVERR